MEKQEKQPQPIANHDFELGIALVAILLIAAITFFRGYDFDYLF